MDLIPCLVLSHFHATRSLVGHENTQRWMYVVINAYKFTILRFVPYSTCPCYPYIAYQLYTSNTYITTRNLYTTTNSSTISLSRYTLHESSIEPWDFKWIYNKKRKAFFHLMSMSRYSSMRCMYLG